MLDVDDLVRTYGPVRALDGMTFSVRPGVVTGFLGPNGAGKTTTMRAIFGLTALDAGAVRWDGAPITDAVRRRFGYLPEERGLYPNMRIADQLRLPRSAARTEQGDGERTGAFVAATPRPRRPGAEQPRGALARQPAARAADQRPRPRARRAGARRTVLGARPGRRRRAVRGARRARPAAARRCCSRRTSSTSSSTCARTRSSSTAAAPSPTAPSTTSPPATTRCWRSTSRATPPARGPLASTRRIQRAQPVNGSVRLSVVDEALAATAPPRSIERAQPALDAARAAGA